MIESGEHVVTSRVTSAGVDLRDAVGSPPVGRTAISRAEYEERGALPRLVGSTQSGLRTSGCGVAQSSNSRGEQFKKILFRVCMCMWCGRD